MLTQTSRLMGVPIFPPIIARLIIIISVPFDINRMAIRPFSVDLEDIVKKIILTHIHNINTE